MKRIPLTRKILTVMLLVVIAHVAVPPSARTSPARAQDPAAQMEAPANKITPDLQEKLLAELSADDRVSVILQLNDEPSGVLHSLLTRSGVHVKGNFENFGSIAVELPATMVEQLASFDEVSVVDDDSEMRVLGHVVNTTGTQQVRFALGSGTELDGSGIGIAVLDSGVFKDHKTLLGTNASGNSSSRVVYSKDFTNERRVDDYYGHGSHVAAAAAGNGSIYDGAYSGIAPGANIINLRVLKKDGTGSKSTVINALNWIATYGKNYNIRVVNMSLGTPAITSYSQDTLCLAVRKLVNSGIVVVAAAGNNGKDAQGQKQYGLIHSPGNEPSAITVGATNTFGTNSRADDVVTSYS
jgi:serine protease AprX